MKTKSLLTGLFAICLLASPVFATNGNGRIDVSLSSGEIQFEKSTDKHVKIAYPHWYKDEVVKKRNITTNLKANDQTWTQITIEFTPTQDSNAKIALRGQWNKTKKQWVYFDDISIEGIDLKNTGFEEKGGWKIATAQLLSDDSIAHAGKAFANVWHDKPAYQSFKVKGGESVKITAWVKFNQFEDKPAKK